MSNTLQTTHDNESFLSKDNISHWLKVAEMLSKSDMTPRSYKNKASDTLIAMELGRTWNLQPLQAIQNIAVINGKPCAYGDLVLAICSNHPEFEDIREEPIMSGGEVVGYKCTVKRRKRSSVQRTFTKEQAINANLWGKQGPWKQYPDRMLQMRARGFALRDSFADALNGVSIREEVEDYQVKERDVTPAKNEKPRVDQLLDLISDTTQEETQETDEVAAMEQIKEIHTLINAKGFNQNGRLQKAIEHYGIEKLSDLTSAQADDFISKLQKAEDVKKENGAEQDG